MIGASMSTGGVSAIEVRDLRKTYAGGVEAVRGISFSVRQGEVFGLLGPNGAGKSTTIRILTTLAHATAGSARVAGFDVGTQGREVRRAIGYVAQTSGVDGLATGRENLMLQGRLFHLPAAEIAARTRKLLALFRLDDAADRLAQTYSGGMKRRLDVAMGLIHRPQVLFLDEPTTGLDPESAGFSSALALLTRRQEIIIAASNFTLTPMIFSSSMLMSQDLMPAWLKAVARINPVEWAVIAARNGYEGRAPGQTAFFLLLSAGFALACGAFATRAFVRYQRSM